MNGMERYIPNIYIYIYMYSLVFEIRGDEEGDRNGAKRERKRELARFLQAVCGSATKVMWDLGILPVNCTKASALGRPKTDFKIFVESRDNKIKSRGYSQRVSQRA